MVFVEYKTAGCKQQVRNLLRKRLSIKDKIRYHLNKIKNFKEVELPKIEKQLDFYLERAGN